MNLISQKRTRVLFKDTEENRLVNNRTDDFYYKEIADLTAAGGYSVDFEKKTSLLDPAARRILNTPEDYHASLYSLINFYPEGTHRDKATALFMSCSEGEAFSTTVKMTTYDGKEFWVKANGRPIYGKKNRVVGIQGVFQDINQEKLKELSLENSLKVIESQNSKLLNFAHIVSHNLRSHASNFQLTLELLATIQNPNQLPEETELLTSLGNISSSLNDTISHLNEIVSIQNSARAQRSNVDIQSVFKRVTHALSYAINSTKTEILDDFSEVPELEYIDAYIESIMLNLLSNAIKYKHPDRKPEIQICTFIEDERPCLLIKDNGMGIDLEKNSQKIFNIYQTFHYNKDAVGVGLFITKNQVESLGGTIEVKSKVDIGTTFIIKF